MGQAMPATYSLTTQACAPLGVPEDELTHGELRVLQMLVRGASNREIAGQAQISENTVKFHLKNVYGKLGVGSRKAAAHLALTRGLVAAAS